MRLPAALTARAVVQTGRDFNLEKATDSIYPAIYFLRAQPRWFGRWALVCQDIMFAGWDRHHTQYIFPARVVSRTNRLIAPPTGTLRRREQDHRDQRIEEHIKDWEQSGATARGRFTLELLWPLTLPPDPTPDLGRPWLPWSDSRGLRPSPCPLTHGSTHGSRPTLQPFRPLWSPQLTHGSLQVSSGLFS